MHAADLHTKAEWLERQDMPPRPSPGRALAQRNKVST